ncbi:hypothetical protein ACMFMG_010250 [Clarireedia jacksonii]
MMIGRNSGVFVQAHQPIAMRSFHKVFWRWQALGKNCEKYQPCTARSIFSHASDNPSKLAMSMSQARRCPRFYSSAPATASAGSAREKAAKKSNSLNVSNPTSSADPVDTYSSSIVLELDNNPDLIPEEDVAPQDDIAEEREPPAPLPPISSNLRDIMRRLVNSVVVMAVPHYHAGTAQGVTLSSFTTVALNPKPIVTFNIKRPSRTLNALKATLDASTPDQPSTFEIYILEARAAAVDIATAFSCDGGPLDISILYNITTEKARRVLKQGIRRALVCKLLDGDKGIIEVGDHTLVLGEVVEIQQPEPTLLPTAGNEHRVLRGLRGLKAKEKEERKKQLPEKFVAEKNWNSLAYHKGQYVNMEHTPVKKAKQKKSKT